MPAGVRRRRRAPPRRITPAPSLAPSLPPHHLAPPLPGHHSRTITPALPLPVHPPLPMLSVLVIDDDVDIRDTLVEFFAALGHVARGAGTATEGRRVAAEHSPDVALVDLRLPDAHWLVLL